MGDEIKMLPKEERDEIMKKVNFSVFVSPEQGLAMKSDLCIPWRKLRLMRRYSVFTILHVPLIIIDNNYFITDG